MLSFLFSKTALPTFLFRLQRLEYRPEEQRLHRHVDHHCLAHPSHYNLRMLHKGKIIQQFFSTTFLKKRRYFFTCTYSDL